MIVNRDARWDRLVGCAVVLALGLGCSPASHSASDEGPVGVRAEALGVVSEEIESDAPLFGAGSLPAGGARIATAPSGLSLAVWGANGDIYGARLDENGVLLDLGGFPISEVPLAQTNPDVAWVGGRWLVVWEDLRGSWDIYGAFVTPDAAVSDPDGLALATGDRESWNVALASSATQWLVVWSDWRAGTSDILGARIDADGTLLDPSGFVIAEGTEFQQYPAVSSNGAEFLTVWEQKIDWYPPDLYGARIASDGAVLDPTPIAISTGEAEESTPSVASNGANWLVAWTDRRTEPPDVYGARVASDGAVLDPTGIAISSAPEAQTEPTVASDGEEYLVGWRDARAERGQLRGTRVSGSGVVLGDEVALSPPASFGLAASFTGSHWQLSWSTYSETNQEQVFRRRLDAELTPLDPAPELLSLSPNAQDRPNASWNGKHWLVVWSDTRDGGVDIYGARYTADGTLLDPDGIAIGVGAYYQDAPAVDYDGTNWLVAWYDTRSGVNVYAARVADDGSVLDSGTRLTGGNNVIARVDVARGEAGWLVVWGTYDSKPSDGDQGYDVVGVRVAPDGRLLDPTPIGISTSPGVNESAPSVGFDGSDWLVFWQDDRSAHWQIYGSRVSPTGVVRDPGGFLVSDDPASQLGPQQAFDDGSRSLVVWTDHRNGVSDVYGAIVTSGAELQASNSFPIATGEQEHVFPSVTFAGDEWLVAWGDDRRGQGAADLYANTVSRSGLVDPDDEIVISDARRLERWVTTAGGPGRTALVSYVTSSGGHVRVRSRIWSAKPPPGGGPPGPPDFFGCYSRVMARRAEGGAGFALLLLGALIGLGRRRSERR